MVAASRRRAAAHVTDPSVLQQNIRRVLKQLLHRGDAAQAGDPAGDHGGLSRPPFRAGCLKLPGEPVKLWAPMATKTSPSRRSSSRASAARPQPRRRPQPAAKKPAHEKKPAAPGPDPLAARPRRPRHRARRARRRSRCSSVWFDAAGPVGRLALDVAAARLVRASPRCRSRSSASCWGIVLLRDTAREDARAHVHRVPVLHARGPRDSLSLLRWQPGRRPTGYDAAVAAPAGVRRRARGVPALAGRSRRSAPRSCASGLAVLGMLVFTGDAVASVVGDGRATPSRAADATGPRRTEVEPEPVVQLASTSQRQPKRDAGRGRLREAARPRRAGLADAGRRRCRASRRCPRPDRSRTLDEELSRTPSRRAPRPRARGPDDRDGGRALPAAAARPAPRLRRPPTADGARRGRDHGGARAHAPHLRRGRARRRARTAAPPSRCTRSRSPRARRSTRCCASPSDIAYALATPDVRIQAPIPGQVRDRHRGPEQAPRLRDARRHPPFEGREGGDAPARGRARQGRPRRARRW